MYMYRYPYRESIYIWIPMGTGGAMGTEGQWGQLLLFFVLPRHTINTLRRAGVPARRMPPHLVGVGAYQEHSSKGYPHRYGKRDGMQIGT